MKRHTLWALLAILALALGLRLGRWSEERAGILGQVPTGDERTYDAWAQRIAAGTQPPAVPYQAPLPAHVLATCHRWLAPPAARDAYRLLGVMLGIMTCGLAFALGRELAGDTAGLVAAALVALHAPLIYYEPTLLRDGPAAALLALAAWLALRALDRARAADPAAPAWPWAATTGLTLGVGALWRENVLLVGGLLALVGAAVAWRRPRWRRAVAALALGLLLPLTPVWVANARLEGSVSPFPTWNGGCVFYIANQRLNRGVGYMTPPFVRFANPEAEVEGFRAEAERRAGKALTPHAISSFWLREGLAEVRAEPGLYLRKLLQRGAYAVASQEFVHARDPRLDAQSSWVLRLPLPGFGLLLGFACVGGWSLRRRPQAWIAAGLAAAALGTTLPVAFATRYRLPAVALVAALAAAGLAHASRAARRSGRWRPLLVGLALSAACTSIPVPHDDRAGRWSRALAYLESGQPAPAFDEVEAIALPGRAAYWERVSGLLALNHELPLAAQARQRARASWEAWARELERSGRAEPARQARERAARLAPPG